MNWLVVVLAITSLGLAGCNKSKLQESQQVEGVSVEMPKLEQLFATSTNPQLKALAAQAAYGLRYADYVKTLMALDQLSASPDATEVQKKMVTNVIDQVKKLAAAPAGQAPAQ